jgi:RNA polymerase sigma factor (sigma-70 family)
MSSATSSTAGDFASKGSFFWIRPVDDEGFAIDERFAAAAHGRSEQLRLYRADELADAAVRADLVELAVQRAVRVDRMERIRDPGAYVVTSFRRLVDDRIARDRAVTNSYSEMLDRVPNDRSAVNARRTLDSQILCDEALDVMDSFCRQAWIRHLQGHSFQAIAAELGISADSLSARLRRSLAQVRRKFSKPAAGSGEKPNGNGRTARTTGTGMRTMNPDSPGDESRGAAAVMPCVRTAPPQSEFGCVPLLEPLQVAAWLGVSASWVREHALRKHPRIRAVRVGKLIRFRREDVQAFIDSSFA